MTYTLEHTVTWHPGATNAGPIRFHINAWDLDKEALNRFREETGSQLGLRDYRRSIRDGLGDYPA